MIYKAQKSQKESGRICRFPKLFQLRNKILPAEFACRRDF